MSSFVDSACEALAPLGRIERKRMFGGYGLYLDGRIFAVIVRDTLYFKTDAQTVAQFDASGLPPLSFERDGKAMVTWYRQAPEEVFEDRDVARQWGDLAMQAALRAPLPKPKKAAPVAKRQRTARS